MRFLLFYVGAVLIFGACVSNKKFLYMQKNDVNKADLPKDTVLRTYTVSDYDYKIQSQDILSVRFESLTPQEFDFLSRQRSQAGGENLIAGNALLIGELVDHRGEIPFPVVGKIKVAGMNIFQLQDTLQSIANRYLESPTVKVRLLNFRITVLGEVNKEGSITLNNPRVTMLEAIGLAGGLGELADRANVKLIRQIGSKTEVIYINLLQEDFMNSPYYYVHQNDVLIVPGLRQRPFRKYFGPNLALLVSALSLLVLTINLSKN